MIAPLLISKPSPELGFLYLTGMKKPSGHFYGDLLGNFSQVKGKSLRWCPDDGDPYCVFDRF